MILRSWITENCKGNIIGIRIFSHSTGHCFSEQSPEKILTKDLDIEAITKYEGN